MYGNKLAKSEWFPRRSVIGSVESTASGNVVLRVGQVWQDDPDRWSQTEHVVLTRNEVAQFLREVVEVMEPTTAETLTLKLDRELAAELLDHVAAAPRANPSDRFGQLWERLADFVHPEG